MENSPHCLAGTFMRVTEKCEEKRGKKKEKKEKKKRKKRDMKL